MTPDVRKPDRRPMDKRVAEKKAADKKVEERARARLDQPQDVRRSIVGRSLVRRPAVDQDRFGSFAEQFARFMGTARFLIYMTLFVVFWVGWNVLAPSGSRFDNYPFIFLTLMLSLQASYAAPLILLAQNRQEVRDRVMTEQDRQANARGHADMEFLAREVASLRMALGEVATRDFLRSELRGLLAELGQREDDHDTDADAEKALSGDEDHRS
ncbi:MAG: rane protein [Marmoricola sp.]|nr:rane protein [Marmoricola sp.]